MCTEQAFKKHIARFGGDAAAAGQHGPSSRMQVTASLKKRFAKLDEDDNQFLDAREMANLLKAGDPSITARELRAIFKNIDTNSDGMIDFDEFVAYLFDDSPEDDEELKQRHSMELSLDLPLTPGTSLQSKEPETIIPSKQGPEEFTKRYTSPAVLTGAIDAESPRCTAAAAIAPERIDKGFAADRRRPQTHESERPSRQGLRARVKPPEGIETSCISDRGPAAAPDLRRVNFGYPQADDTDQQDTATAEPTDAVARRRTRKATMPPRILPASSFVSAPSGGGPPVKMLIVRHAQSANKEKVKMNGQAAVSKDPELSAKGFEEAEALGQRWARDFKRRQPQGVAVVCSPMKRCLLTIRPAIQSLSLGREECLVHASCYEYGCAGKAFGGTGAMEIAEKFPEFQLVGFAADGTWDYQGSNDKENEADARERGGRVVEWLRGFAETLRQRSPRGEPCMLLCIHQTLTDLLLHQLIRGSSKDWVYGCLSHRLRNAGFTTVVFEPSGEIRILVENDFAHLRGLEIPPEAMSPKTRRLVALRAKFAKLDSNASGKLDYKEMSSLLRSGDPSLSEDTMWALFQDADKDRDGEVDFFEFIDYVFGKDVAR